MRCNPVTAQTWTDMTPLNSPAWKWSALIHGTRMRGGAIRNHFHIHSTSGAIIVSTATMATRKKEWPGFVIVHREIVRPPVADTPNMSRKTRPAVRENNQPGVRLGSASAHGAPQGSRQAMPCALVQRAHVT